MKHTKIFYACLAGALMLGGCFKDTGNYDYSEPFVIKVETDAINFAVTAGTRLEITPSITPADREYEYYWCVYDSKPNPKVDTISRSKDLDYTVTLEPTHYNLVYSVTDKKSGIQKITLFGITVGTIYTKGLYVLKEQDGHTDLDLHTDNDLQSNLIAMTNDGYSPAGNARDIAHFTNYRVYNEEKNQYDNQVVLFVASSQDMCAVRLASMKLDATFNDGLFYLTPEVVNPQTIFRSLYNGFGFVNNGKLYSIDTSTVNSGTFGTSAPGDYELDVHKVGYSYYSVIMFDKKNNRLVQANNYSISDIVESGEQVPPVKNLNSEILFTSPINSSLAFMMLKSKINNTYQLRKLNVAISGTIIDKNLNAAYWNLDDTYPITQGTHWAAFWGNEGLFYARGNEIYYCNVAGGFIESKQATVHDASKETITYMWHLYALNNINKLAIATHAEGKYKVYLYDILAGTLQPNPVVYSGDGKAVKLIYVNNAVSTNMY